MAPQRGSRKKSPGPGRSICLTPKAEDEVEAELRHLLRGAEPELLLPRETRAPKRQPVSFWTGAPEVQEEFIFFLSEGFS